MNFTVFLGNLPTWVTSDDIQSWLTAENLVADHIKVIRNPETQESRGFAFIDAPNQEEMQSIIRRFDRAPLEDRLLRANPAQPPRSKRPGPPTAGPQGGDRRGSSDRGSGDRASADRGSGDRGSGDRASSDRGSSDRGSGDRASSGSGDRASSGSTDRAGSGSKGAGDRDRRKRSASTDQRAGKPNGGSASAFAEELAKAL
jgi:RNA recognition motif-containing protein